MYLRWPRVTALVSTTLVIIPGLADTDTSLVKVPSASESQFPPLKNISLSTCVEPEPARAGSDYIHRLSRVYFAFPVILTQGESRRLPRTRFRSQLQPKSGRNLVTYSHNLDRGLDSHQQGCLLLLKILNIFLAYFI